MKKRNLLSLEAILLGTMLLTGCGKNKSNNSNPTKKEITTIETTQDFSIDDVKNYSFIVLYNYDQRTTDYHIVYKKIIKDDQESKYACYDVLTDELVFVEPTEEIIEPTEDVLDIPNIYKSYEMPLGYYLAEENYIKDYYSKKDIRLLLSNLRYYYEDLTNIKSLKLKKD